MPVPSPILDEMPVVDATDRLPARLSLITPLIEHGCVHIRKLLSSDKIQDLSSQISSLLLAASWVTDLNLQVREGDFHCEPGLREGHTYTDDAWPTVYSRIQALYAFHGLANDSRLLTCISHLLQATAITHPRKICRLSFPHPSYCMPPHTDRGFNPLPADVITAWIPLLNCGLSNGILIVRDQSIRDQLASPEMIDNYKDAFASSAEFTGRWLYPSCEPGDVVLFHSTSAHGSLRNSADRARLSVDYRYQAAEDPIHWSALLPHGYARGLTASWTQLTKSWPDLLPLDASQPSSVGFRLTDRSEISRLLG